MSICHSLSAAPHISSADSFYAGQHVGPEPNKGLCIAQTSLMYGITPMYVCTFLRLCLASRFPNRRWSVAVLMLVYHLSMTIDGGPSNAKFARLKLYMVSPRSSFIASIAHTNPFQMLVAPYIALAAFCLACFIVSSIIFDFVPTKP